MDQAQGLRDFVESSGDKGNVLDDFRALMAIEDREKSAMGALIDRARNDNVNAVDYLWAAGYRLDPYPNGKSKAELIARIEALEAERDKTRNLFRKEHEKWVRESFSISMEKHYELDPHCPVCNFLAETSTVKS